MSVIKLLLDFGGHRCITSDVLGQAAYSGHEDTLRLLLDHAEGVELNGEAVETCARCWLAFQRQGIAYTAGKWQHGDAVSRASYCSLWFPTRFGSSPGKGGVSQVSK